MLLEEQGLLCHLVTHLVLSHPPADLCVLEEQKSLLLYLLGKILRQFLFQMFSSEQGGGGEVRVLHLTVRCNQIARARWCIQGELEELLAKGVCKRLHIWLAEASSERVPKEG